MEQRDVLPRLRGSLDSNDTFVSGGHQIIKTAGATRHAERMQKVPLWALDDAKLADYVNYRFPNVKTDKRQRKRALKLVRMIYLYYRVGMTSGAVAEELKMKPEAVRKATSRLEKNMVNRPNRPGRRKSVTIQTSDESLIEL